MMENFDDSPLEWENEELYDDQKEKWIVKHHIMIIIDVSLLNTNFFSTCIDVCKNLIIKLIKQNRNDKVGIMLLGTNDDNKTCPKYINVLSEPKKPNIDMIKMLDNLSSSKITNATLLTSPLADALWYSSYLIKKCNENQSCSSIMLITCNDHPKFSDSMKQFNLRKRLDDIIKNDIDFKLIPIGEEFNMNMFYDGILSNFNSIIKPTHGFENVNDIMSEINQKIKHGGRSISKIKFFIDDDSYIFISLYNFYTKSKIPAKIRLDKKTNQQLTSINQVFTLESNELLFKSDIGKYIIIAQQKILFKNEDILVLKSSIIEPGIRLLGFTDKNNIFISYHYKTSTFLRPSDGDGTLLFNSLLESCLEMNKNIMCFIKVREGARVHLAALIPQDEIVDQEGVQQQPAGFYCMYLPFLECSRKISPLLYDRKEITDQQITLAKTICDKMYIDYCPALIKNPKLNCHWAMLEAMALDLGAPSILDETLPQNDVIDNNLSILKKDITQLFPKSSNFLATTSKKRNASSSYGNKKIVKKTK